MNMKKAPNYKQTTLSNALRTTHYALHSTKIVSSLPNYSLSGVPLPTANLLTRLTSLSHVNMCISASVASPFESKKVT